MSAVSKSCEAGERPPCPLIDKEVNKIQRGRLSYSIGVDESPLAAARVGVVLRRVVAHPPVVAFGQDRFVWMGAPAMFNVAVVVIVAHQ